MSEVRNPFGPHALVIPGVSGGGHPYASRIYVASSWRNADQPAVVRALAAAGHFVYDFRHDGFSWRDVDPEWETWTPRQYRDGLRNHIARAGYERDLRALNWCDVCVLVQPCGRSAAFDLGYAAGARAKTFILVAAGQEPELMFAGAEICLDVAELLEAIDVATVPL